MHRTESLVVQRDFLRLWSATALSEAGTSVTALALPLTAVTLLHATAFQVGLLTTFQYLAFLAIGLPAGAWVDRMRRRRVMVVADLGRFAVLGTVPMAALSHALTIRQLYLVVLLAGVLTVFFDVSAQSYLPALVGRDRLVEGNAKLQGTKSAAEVAGPSLGGLLVQALTAPIAVAVDAASYLWSAAWLASIRHTESRPARANRPLVSEIREGVALVLHDPSLRAVAACTAGCNLWFAALQPMQVVFLARTVHLSAWLIGAAQSGIALGGVAGAFLARPLARRLGEGTVIWLSIAATSPLLLAQPFVRRDWTLAAFALAQLAVGIGVVVYNITQVSFRQAICPDHLLGRMNATMRFFVWGVMPLGGLLSGGIAARLGVRAVLAIAAVGMTCSFLWVYFSPLRRMRTAAASA
ncbi:MAG TPA: MFS transporter [Streptosporangiales bacterium]